MHKILTALCLALGSALGSCVLPAEAADRGPKVVSPAAFVTRAALSDMFETQSSELAAVKADKRTRAFAAMMNADHQKTSSQLRGIVKGHAEDLPLPPRLDPAHQKLIDRLKGLDGDAFTKQYQADQLQAHVQAIALFEAFATNGVDAQLRQWAAQTLPKLKEHLKEAKALAHSAWGQARLKKPRR